MVARIRTVAFQGIEVSGVDVQVQVASGLPVTMAATTCRLGRWLTMSAGAATHY